MTPSRPFQAVIWFALAGLVAFLSGCVSAKPKMTTEHRDRMQFAANQPRPSTNNYQLSTPTPISLPRVAGADDDLGYVEPVNNLCAPEWKNYRVTWDQPGNCRGWRIQYSSNLVEWITARTVWNEFVTANPRDVTLRVKANPVFWRIERI